MTHHLVGMAEIAEMLGVTRQRVAQLIESYEDFPAPEVELTAGRIWSRTAIETWIAHHPERRAGRPAAGSEPELFAGQVTFTFERFTDRARSSIVKAQEEARLLNHNYIGTEHLLLGLLAIGEGLAFDVFTGLGVGTDATRAAIVDMIGRGPVLPTGNVPFTPRAKKTLELALRESITLGHNYIGTEHVLLALIREKDGVAWKSLAQLGLKRKETRDRVLEAMTSAGVPVATSSPDKAELLARLEELKRLIEDRPD